MALFVVPDESAVTAVTALHHCQGLHCGAAERCGLRTNAQHRTAPKTGGKPPGPAPWEGGVRRAPLRMGFPTTPVP